ncbi:MAG: HDIG domain-containing metalloprotein [Planctomycetota bacterium]
MKIRRRRKTRRFSADRVRTLVAEGPVEGTSPLRYERLCVAVLAALAIALLAGMGRRPGEFLAASGATGTLLGLGAIYLLRYQRECFADLRRLLTLVLVAVALGGAAQLARGGPATLANLLPIPLAALLLSIVFSPRLAIEVTALLTLLAALTIGPREDLVLVLVVLFAGAVLGALSATRVRKRSTLVRVGLVVGLFMALLHFTLVVAIGGVAVYEWNLRGGIALGHGVISGFLLTGLLPAIEHLTGTVTDIRLLELSNQNEQPLLRRLLLTAPGTHHHSFVVGTLAESAAEAIGAHALLCRVGAYYHDIGKMNKPEYFSENSVEARIKHSGLSPEMSTLVITAHPKDGLELADYYGLPEPLKAFIAEHHGTTAVEYFYQKALEQRGEVARDAYRYAGPRPQSRETAILMLADSVEASSRTLRDPTPARIEALIDEIVRMKMEDGQLDDCQLTMRELNKIKEAFLQVLLGIYHYRPSYPRTVAGAASPDDSQRRTSSGMQPVGWTD